MLVDEHVSARVHTYTHTYTERERERERPAVLSRHTHTCTEDAFDTNSPAGFWLPRHTRG